MTDLEYHRNYFRNNRDRFAMYGARQRDRIKAEMIEAYGGKCKDCGESDPIVLSLDHINDDSDVEKQLYGLGHRGGHHHYLRLKREGWPQERFQLLCFNCNARKEHLRRREGMNERLDANKPVPKDKTQAARKKPSNNKSGIKGVFWDKQKSKWHVVVMIDYKINHIGFFDDIRDAALAYRVKAVELLGPLANIPTDEEIEMAVKVNTNLQAIVNSDELGL